MWQRRHLLGLKDLDKKDIELILGQAEYFREIPRRQIKKVPSLRGKTVVNLFFEPSTRTRISFELAAKRLSADVINFSSSASSIQKGESILDTLKNMEAYAVDIFVIRHSFSAASVYLAQRTKACVVNAGDGANEHPTQALLDMFTVKQRLKKLTGLKVVIVGDIAYSRVARSNIWGFSHMGCEVWLCAPPTLLGRDFSALPVRITYDLRKAVKEADVIIMLRLQSERQSEKLIPSLREYRQHFGLNPDILKGARRDAVIMHPGPVNWDVEIASSLKEKIMPSILNQASNGLAVRMAVLYLLKGAAE